jgi:hypothetical protein
VPETEQTEHTRLTPIVLLSALAVALLSLGLYLRTLHPGVGPSLDSMELQIAALVNGVIHPPGSPQYLVLGKLAMHALPGPSMAYRLNLLSALCAAATVGVIHLLAYRLTRNLIASSYASLSLALAVRFWYQASVAELYTPNALYVALVMYLLVAWHQTRRPATYWAAAAVYALSFGNHVSMILLLPAFVYIVWITDRSMLLRPRNLLITLAIVVLAALQYLVIPLRVAADPPFCNYCPSTAALPTYLTGGPFRAQMFALPRREVAARLPESIGQWNAQFMPWGYALGVVGAWEMLRRQRKLAWVLIISLLAEYVFVMGYAIPDWHDFLTPVYVIFAPLVAFGALRLWELTAPHVERLFSGNTALLRRVYLGTLAGAALLSMVIIAAVNLPLVDRSGETDYQVNGRILLSHAEPGAWLLMPHPHSTAFYYSWALRYLAFAEDLAPGLVAIAPQEVDPPPGPEPYYRAWADAAPNLTPDALVETRPQVFVVDPDDARIAGLGLLPICTPDGQTIAGYEVVAVLSGGEPVPLVEAERWQTVREYVVFGGEEARCPN